MNPLMLETSTTNATRRQGAMAAVAAMLKQAECAGRHEDTPDAYLANKALALHAITNAAGPISPYLSGFVEAIAEALLFHETTGIPDLLVWKPEAAMTEEELAEARQQVADSYDWGTS